MRWKYDHKLDKVFWYQRVRLSSRKALKPFSYVYIYPPFLFTSNGRLLASLNHARWWWASASAKSSSASLTVEANDSIKPQISPCVFQDSHSSSHFFYSLQRKWVNLPSYFSHVIYNLCEATVDYLWTRPFFFFPFYFYIFFPANFHS